MFNVNNSDSIPEPKQIKNVSDNEDRKQFELKTSKNFKFIPLKKIAIGEMKSVKEIKIIIE